MKPPVELRGQEAVATPEKRSEMHRPANDAAAEVTRDLPYAIPDAPAVDTTVPSTPFEPQVGMLVDGRYRLKAQLGEGGMGVVFSAHNERTDKEVALKFLRVHHCSARQRQTRIARFVREGRAAGRIDHPNVVQVYDVGGDANFPYLVMERLHGETLWQRMSRRDLTIDAVIDILIQVMHGVAAAHARGVVHRDIKPDNIFLATGPGAPRSTPKVLDFGVSRLVEPEDSERSTTLTRQGLLIGTPSYMPLEQLRGDRNVDARADVYALGVVLYEALTGTRPFEAKNDHELAIKMATTEARPLHSTLAAEYRGLDPIMRKALARDPETRYADAAAFAQALEAFRNDPVAAAAAFDSALAAGPGTARANRARPITALLWGLALASVAAISWALLEARSPPRVTAPRAPFRSLGAAPAEELPKRSSPPSPSAVQEMPGSDTPLAPESAAPRHHERQRQGGAPRPKEARSQPKSARVAESESQEQDRATTLLPADF